MPDRRSMTMVVVVSVVMVSLLRSWGDKVQKLAENMNREDINEGQRRTAGPKTAKDVIFECFLEYCWVTQDEKHTIHGLSLFGALCVELICLATMKVFRDLCEVRRTGKNTRFAARNAIDGILQLS
jgi:hypothetical protein